MNDRRSPQAGPWVVMYPLPRQAHHAQAHSPPYPLPLLAFNSVLANLTGDGRSGFYAVGWLQIRGGTKKSRFVVRKVSHHPGRGLLEPSYPNQISMTMATCTFRANIDPNDTVTLQERELPLLGELCKYRLSPVFGQLIGGHIVWFVWRLEAEDMRRLNPTPYLKTASTPFHCLSLI
ncbi:hypothetical protein B0J17DRAFT_627561 [Rhizoctonia solani]|nr:hypothetical protein B0J17DRAFT_627561 [Rhizoctonia solani]